jgi:hypothetical protein
MSLDYKFTKRVESGLPVNTLSRDTTIARVVDIIMDDSHPEYDKYGKLDSIGMIKYYKLGTQKPVDDSTVEAYTGVAFPIDRNRAMYPLKNEVVLLTKGPSFSVENQKSDSKDFYQTVFSIYNHIHHNALPPDTGSKSVDIGTGIDEQGSIAPLQPLPGDYILQGRLGNSIRLSGGLSTKSPWTDDSNKNAPITIIRNGQKESEQGYGNILEDINEDSTSIYLTSNHSLPLNLANNKRDSYNDIPDTPSNYQGSQLLINSNRLTLNAKESDILLSSATSIGLNSNTVNIDSNEYMCIDSDKIYLGVKARTNQGANKQPAVLGHRMEAFMQEVLDQLIAMAKAMGAAKVTGHSTIPVLNFRGNSAEIVLKQLKRKLNPKGGSNLKSKKLFIE